MAIARMLIFILAAGAMAVGALMIVGVLVPRNLPEEFRVVMGVVVLLYGLYRSVVEYVRMANERRDSQRGLRNDRADGM
jgi:membrane protein implicated in regulation of membrane protease activity